MCRESNTKLHSSLGDHNYYKSGETNSDLDSDAAVQDINDTEISEMGNTPTENFDFCSDREEIFVCMFCKRNFHSKHTLDNHVKTHVHSDDLVCKVGMLSLVPSLFFQSASSFLLLL